MSGVEFFKGIVKDINSDSISVLSDGHASAEFSGYIDTGSYMLNALLSGSIFGGMPNNKILMYAGEPSSGKTFFALSKVKRFLEDNPTGAVFYFDTESATTSKMMSERGIDPNRVIVVEPETVQDFRHRALQILRKYSEAKPKDRPPMMFVLDSLGQMSTTKEMEDSEAGSETKDMTKAQIIKATFRVLTLRCGKLGVPFIVNNHVYTEMGLYAKKVASGGTGSTYVASTVVFLSKAKDKNGTEVVGNIITARTEKSRFTKEQKSVKLRLDYIKGLDRYYGLVDLACEYDIWEKSAGFVITQEGKFRENAIYKEPERFFTDDILQKLDVAAKEEFCFGSALPDDDELMDEEDILDDDTSA